LESGRLFIPGRGEVSLVQVYLLSNILQSIVASPDFQLFATQNSTVSARSQQQGGLLSSQWMRVVIEPLPHEELVDVLVHRFPNLTPIIPRLLETFRVISQMQSNPGTISEGRVFPHLRPLSTRDLFKW